MSLVCWSGGCDSTLILHDLAKAASTFHPGTDQGKPVRAISLNYSQVPAHAEQSRARKKILEWFKARGYPVDHTEISIDTNNGLEYHGNPQATMWLLAQQALHVDEHLYSGYHRGDDFWHDGHHLTAAFDHLQKLGLRNGQWVFLLASEHKYQIIDRLKKTGDPGRPEMSLYNLCWWCADLQSFNDDAKIRSEPCGRYQSCITHNLALQECAMRAKIEAEIQAAGPGVPGVTTKKPVRRKRVKS